MKHTDQKQISLSSLSLSVREPEKSLKFYTEIFGMNLKNSLEDSQSILHLLSFPGDQTELELFFEKSDRKLNPYRHQQTDSYWKFSVFTNDIQNRCEILKEKIPISEPGQFRDIGYLAHLADSEGFLIELIQRSFQSSGPFVSKQHKADNIGLITLRVKDPERNIAFYENCFDLKLLVRMRVEVGTGFTLYFLGSRDQIPPSADPDSIINREWMYQRKECFIELQHFDHSKANESFFLNPPQVDRSDLKSVNFKAGDLKQVEEKLKNAGIESETHFNRLRSRKEISLLNPENQLMILSE